MKQTSRHVRDSIVLKKQGKKKKKYLLLPLPVTFTLFLNFFNRKLIIYTLSIFQ